MYNFVLFIWVGGGTCIPNIHITDYILFIFENKTKLKFILVK